MECGYRHSAGSTHKSPAAFVIAWLLIALSSVAAEQRGRMPLHSASQQVESSTIAGRGLTGIQVRLVRGTVTVNATTGSDISMRVVRRSTSTDPRVVVVRASETKGVVRIVSVHPPPLPGVMHECLHDDEELGDFWHYEVTVDVELTIPARLALQVRTMRGDVVVSGIEGNVDVATNDGEIRLKDIRGNLVAAAVGSVDLQPTSTSRPGPNAVKVSAYAGDVRLRIPSGERVRIDGGPAAEVRRDAPEVLRTAATATHDVSVSVESGASFDVGITRGRLIVVPISSSK